MGWSHIRHSFIVKVKVMLLKYKKNDGKNLIYDNLIIIEGSGFFILMDERFYGSEHLIFEWTNRKTG